MSRKDFLLRVLRALALPLALIPGSWRVGLIKGLVVLDSRIGEPAGALRRGFRILDMMDRVIAERATAYGGGIHPKHPLTGLTTVEMNTRWGEIWAVCRPAASEENAG